MKNLIIILFLLIGLSAKAQLDIPEPSPSASFVQTLGFTKIKMEYARPGVKGREVFGKMIPYGEMWRTGASDCSTIGFDEALSIGGKKIPKGKYSIFTIPSQDLWTVVLNTDTTLHGTSGYDIKKDIHRFTIKPEKTTRFYETFTFEISDIVKDNANLYILWENTMIKIELLSTAKERIMADIDNKINKQKSENSKLFYQAAEYYYNQRMELEQANNWIAKASVLEPDNFYFYNLQTKILEVQGKLAEVIPVAQKAIVLAKKQNMTQTASNWEKKVALWQQSTGIKSQISEPHEMKEMKTESIIKKTEIDADVQAVLTLMLSHYYGLKDALIANDTNAASQKAIELTKTLAKIPMAQMTTEQHTLFMSLSEKLRTDAQGIANSKEVKKQRSHLYELSNNFYALIKGMKANQSPVYQQYCPMAKGYWLSDNAAIKNPYYGKMMLTCGKVTETLN